MAKLTYLKLYEFKTTHPVGWPHDIHFVFCDGFAKIPVLAPVMGEIVHESDKLILEADADCIKILGLKKLPGNAVVQYG